MRLRQLTESSEYVTVNKQLNPLLWTDGELNTAVHDKLMAIADAFLEFVAVELTVEDITVTGSNANYTWTKHSDLDLHIIIAGEVTDSARELFTAKKALWGEQHTITIKGLPVECYVQGQTEPHHSTGVYSLMSQKWLVKPEKVKPAVDDLSIKSKLNDLVHQVQVAMDQDTVERLNTVKDRITKMRKSGLERAGEWSTENLVFKQLRNMGLIDDLTERIRELEDQELSLETVKPLD